MLCLALKHSTTCHKQNIYNVTQKIKVKIIYCQQPTSVGEDVKKGTLMNYCWECALLLPLWKIVWSHIKKNKNGNAL